jgi:hypothetical protein
MSFSDPVAIAKAIDDISFVVVAVFSLEALSPDVDDAGAISISVSEL